jgi:hypothetical protein
MPSFDRRAVLSGALSAATASALILPRPARAAGTLPVPPSKALAFKIFRNGKPFGDYKVTFGVFGDFLTVTTDVAMNMNIAKINVFDYRHHCEETWRGGQFTELHARSVRDKQPDLTNTVDIMRSSTGFRITTNKGPHSAPNNAAPLTHWNSEVLLGPLINPEDGTIVEVTVHPVARDMVPTAAGSQLAANHWALRGAQTIDEWYDDSGIWAGLKGVLADKSTVEYRRV